jgi:hypothetical protein
VIPLGAANWCDPGVKSGEIILQAKKEYLLVRWKREASGLRGMDSGRMPNLFIYGRKYPAQ